MSSPIGHTADRWIGLGAIPRRLGLHPGPSLFLGPAGLREAVLERQPFVVRPGEEICAIDAGFTVYTREWVIGDTYPVDAHEVAHNRIDRWPEHAIRHAGRKRRSCHVPTVFAPEAVLKVFGHEGLYLRQLKDLMSARLRILAHERRCAFFALLRAEYDSLGHFL